MPGVISASIWCLALRSSRVVSVNLMLRGSVASLLETSDLEVFVYRKSFSPLLACEGSGKYAGFLVFFAGLNRGS